MDASSATATPPAGPVHPPPPSLRKAGLVLLVIGVADIAYMVYCIARGFSYSSSLNIFALVAGILLLRGSLRSAALIRWVAASMLPFAIATPFIVAVTQPLDLSMVQLRLAPGSVFQGLAMSVFFAGLLYWLFRELGRPDVLAARAAAGCKVRDMRIPLGLGLAGAIAAVTMIPLMLGGERAQHAQSLASAQFGPGYRYHTSSISFVTNNRGTHVAASVTVWNQNEIRQVPVEWNE